MNVARVEHNEFPIDEREVQGIDSEFTILDIFRILKRRIIPFGLTFGAIVIATAGITVKQTPVFQSKGQILISKTNDASALTGLADQLSLDPLSNKTNPLETEIQVLLSNPILENVIESLDLKNKEGEKLKAGQFRQEIKASSINDTDVLEVAYNSDNPQTSADVVNSVMHFYLKNDIEVNRSQTRAARQFISQQIPRAERQLSQAESNLRQFKEKFGVVELVGEAQESVKRIADLKAAIITAESNLIASQERSRQLQDNFGGLQPEEAIALGKVSESRSIQTTLLESKKIEDELAVARSVLQANHPEINNLESKLSAVQANLSTRIQETSGNLDLQKNQGNFELGETIGLELMTELVKSDVETRSLQEQLISLQSEYEKAISRTEKLPLLEQKQAELLRDLEVAKQSYGTLLESYQKAQLAENQNLGNARIINQAVIPDTPIAPRKILNMLMGSMLGLMCATGVSLLLESKDIKVRSVKDIKDIVPFTILGTIPLFNKALSKKNKIDKISQLPVRDMPQSVISETYRMINTNLKFSRSDRLQIIVISSSIPGEGKSTTLANLALGYAELGAKVLLIDGDLRRPSQHQIWEIPNRIGFSNLLIERTNFNHIPIIEEQPNFHILTSGSIPPNPTTLLDSESCENLMNELREHYDYILIDAPPVTVASDAILLANVSDGLIFVSRPEIANRPALRTAKDILKQSKSSILGMIINGVNIKNESSSYYYYSNEYYGSSIKVEATPIQS